MGAVLLLEDDDDLRAVLQEALQESGHAQTVLACRSVREVTDLGTGALSCTCAILDVNLGEPGLTGIDAANNLRALGFAARIVFLTGHAGEYPQLVEQTRLPETFLLEKPVALTTLFSLVGSRVNEIAP